MKNCILIFSGGMDSTTLLYYLLDKGLEVKCISFNYGQRHKKELDYAQKTCQKLGLEHKIVDITSITELLKGSSLTDNIKTPYGHYEEESMKKTIVPNRNMIMCSIAGAWAVSEKADYLALGVHSGDHTIYPDCRPEFIKVFEEALQLGNWEKVEVLTPFINWDKGDIAMEGKRLGMDYDETWTCYEGKAKPCSKCGACVERMEALEKVKLI